jgi:transcriptional regulator with XRE-family HTH domain
METVTLVCTVNSVNESESDVAIALGRAMRETRVAAHRSLNSVAAEVGSSPSYVSDCERGRRLPSLDWLVRWATALETSVSAIMTDRYPFAAVARPLDLAPPPDGRSVDRMFG